MEITEDLAKRDFVERERDKILEVSLRSMKNGGIKTSEISLFHKVMRKLEKFSESTT